jgi:hypothetical protein
LLGLGVPACAILVGAAIRCAGTRALPALLQLIGAIGFMTVVAAHITEAFDLLPWMRWGQEQSPGHYLDLGSAIIGLTAFPAGYLLDALKRRAA